MDPLTHAFTALVDEYEALEGLATSSARSRRTMAMEALTAALFADLDHLLDPNGEDNLDENSAVELLGYTLHVGDMLTSTMLDYREAASRLGLGFPAYRGRLLAVLGKTWSGCRTDLLDGAE